MKLSLRVPLSIVLLCVLAVDANLGICSSDNLAGKQSDSEQSNTRFSHVRGLFVQEDASKTLDVPGQHVNFGALVPWPQILQKLKPDRKLVFLIRHGEAIHNVIQAYVGDKDWKEVTRGCDWRNESSGETYQLFDPPLTILGIAQAEALAELLQNGHTPLEVLTGDLSYATIVSPLSRTLQTFDAVLGRWVSPESIKVDEYCRERFGHNTCDARSPIHQTDCKSAETTGKGEDHTVKCIPRQDLEQQFSKTTFTVSTGSQLGLVSNKDSWWEDDERESDEHIVRRAHKFFDRVFDSVSDQVVFVVTHSGFLGAALQAVGREAYSAVNAEMVPVLVEKSQNQGEYGPPQDLTTA